jgi:heme-degrading monooxygenase HmoA
MDAKQVILRRWVGRIRTADEAAYVAYVGGTGAGDYTHTQGNLGFQILLRALGDGTSEVTTLSWWASMEAVQGFAGDQPELALYYPDDDRFLLDRPPHVDHYRVLAGQVNLTV